MLRDLPGGDLIDLTFDFGPPTGAAPLVGEWDGNGTDTVGVFVEGTLFLRNNNGTDPADLTFNASA